MTVGLIEGKKMLSYTSEPSLLILPSIVTGSVVYETQQPNVLAQLQALNKQLQNQNLELSKKCAELIAENSSLHKSISSLLPMKVEIESSRNMNAAWQWEKTALTLEFDKLLKTVDMVQNERDILWERVQELSNPAEVQRRLDEADKLYRQAQSDLASKKQENTVIETQQPELQPTNDMQARKSWKTTPEIFLNAQVEM